MESTETVCSPPKDHKRITTYEALNGTQKAAIRGHMHSFFFENKKTFILQEVKEFQLVTPEAWKDYIEDAITEESKKYKVDNVIKDMRKEFIITAKLEHKQKCPH
ncbi:hypothetical protein Trydic_g12545 [Trypoxylus dichotomus]